MTPDAGLSDVDPATTAVFIMPGGDMRQRSRIRSSSKCCNRLDESAIPIVAICAATLEVARAGPTQPRRHTSNGLQYLRTMAPDYHGDNFYVDRLAVTDNGLITATSLGAIEFAREIMRQLHIHPEEDITSWFEMFKNGMIPAQWAQN